VVVHSFPLDTNPGWTTMGQWAFGTPAGGGSHGLDPAAGYDGPNVYGYNLAGDYPDSLTPTQYLTTTAIDCTGVTGTKVRFKRWLGVESSSFDHAYVEVSNNGTTWTTVFNHTGGAISETAWSTQEYVISAVADNQPTVYIRWGMGTTDSSVTYPGWNIDNIEIVGVLPDCPGDTDGDGDVDIDDYTNVVLMWGTADPGADLDDDGDVDIDDYTEVVLNWASSC